MSVEGKWDGNPRWGRWKAGSASQGPNWNPWLFFSLTHFFSHPLLSSHSRLFSKAFAMNPPPPSALSVDCQQVATFEHGTELLWSNSYKMPNKTYGQQLPESRSLYTTMDHCYGMGDVMTVLLSELLFFIFPIFLKKKEISPFYLNVSLMMSCLMFMKALPKCVTVQIQVPLNWCGQEMETYSNHFCKDFFLFASYMLKLMFRLCEQQHLKQCL